MNLTSNPCLVCGHSHCNSYSDRRWTAHDASYELLVCAACGSIFSNPMPTDAALKVLYGSTFDYRWYRDHKWAKTRDCLDRLQEYQADIRGRILDYGGGVGHFSAAARARGLDCVTYDPYANPGSVADSAWNTLVALHVLEHSNNIDQTVAEMYGLLAPQGTLILAVPNAAGRGYRELGMGWVWAQPPEVHIFHFTAAGLTELLQRHGFSDVRIGYRERWDANLVFDLKYHGIQRHLDALWGRRPFNRFALYRRLVANVVSKIRFAALHIARQQGNGNAADQSELVITARKPPK